jgi:sugar lactone lactonase YvrE
MQNTRLTTKLRLALGVESLALIYAFLLAGSLGAQSVYTPYTFTTLAGAASSSGSADGTGSAARFDMPYGVATDSSGNVYVVDTDNHTIRKMTPAGAVTTLAGLAGSRGSADGTGSAARFNSPGGVATDSSGNVYVADSVNSTIRKITPGGVVTTLAGLAGSGGSADGTGSAARFYYPSGVATDSSGNVYVTDRFNCTIRKITAAGVVTTLAGLAGSSGSADGTGSAARFYYPEGVATDSSGTVYVADTSNQTIRKITPAGVVTTLAGLAGSSESADGTGSTARFFDPWSVATDSSGNVYVADSNNNTIRKITPAGVVTTLAGLAGVLGSADGTGSAARFSDPQGVATDSSGDVYVADSSNNTIRQITPAGVVTTLAGLAGSRGSADGTGSAARFNGPAGVATDFSGTVYVADYSNHTIRKITPAGVVTTLAGLAGISGSADGTGSEARFLYPDGVATDSSGNVYVADVRNYTIRKITPAGVVTTLAGLAGIRGSADGTGSAARFWYPSGVATDSSGNVYVADYANNTIRKITPEGVVTTLAGLAGSYGSADGTGSAARFNSPAGVGTDSSGNVYVADSYNNTIRKITPAGLVTTLAGLAGITGSADGTGSAARFIYPSRVATDSSGTVYVADSNNNTIRKITPAGAVTTLAGLAGVNPGSADGTGSAARFNGPSGVATDSSGNVYVGDEGNNTIRKGFLPPPPLTILLSGVPPSGIVLTWPTNAAGFTLQSTTNPVSPALWSTNSSAPTILNGQNTVTNPMTGPQQFYRLSR